MPLKNIIINIDAFSPFRNTKSFEYYYIMLEIC